MYYKSFGKSWQFVNSFYNLILTGGETEDFFSSKSSPKKSIQLQIATNRPVSWF